jgi:hypothetical protein
MPILMPKATAVWLVENTTLSFDQIADFCDLHPLEVQGIANDEVAKGIRGVDPIAGGTLSRDEIDRGEANPDHRLRALEPKQIDLPNRKPKKAPRYTPVIRRGEKPNAVMWILKNHPEMTDAQIVKLIGTTKDTIEKVRSRTHWDIQNLRPTDPVTLGLVSQIELDAAVRKADDAAQRTKGRASAADGPTLRPASETVDRAVYDERD